MNIHFDNKAFWPTSTSLDHPGSTLSWAPALVWGIEIPWAWTLSPRVLLPACAIAVGNATVQELAADDRSLLGWRLPDDSIPVPLAITQKIMAQTPWGLSFDPLIDLMQRLLVEAGKDTAEIRNIDLQLLLGRDDYDRLSTEQLEYRIRCACN